MDVPKCNMKANHTWMHWHSNTMKMGVTGFKRQKEEEEENA